MKKVLSVLLAVCLFATLLVPAFAANYGDVIFGEAGDVTKVEFDKTEYKLEDVVTDAGYLDVQSMLTCWDKNGNRTNFDGNGESNTEIRAYWSSNNEVLALNQDTGKLTRIKNNTSSDIKVTVRITLATGKQASTIIVVPANQSENSKDAYGYRLANTTLEEGKFINGSATTNAKLTYTASGADANGNITIAGTPVAVTAGMNAAAVAAEIRANKAQINFNGVLYDVQAAKDANDNVVVWECSNVPGALLAGDEPTDEQLEVIGGKGNTAIGTLGAVTDGKTGTNVIPAVKDKYSFAYTGAGVVTAGDTVTLATGAQYTVADATIASTGTTINMDIANHPTEQTITKAIDEAIALYTAANPSAAYTITNAGGKVTFEAKAAGVLGGTVPNVPTVRLTSFAVSTSSAAVQALNSEATGADETPAVTAEKATIQYTPAAANGAKSLTIGGVTVELVGKERPEQVAAKIAAATGYTIAGKAFTAAQAAGVVTFTAVETGAIGSDLTDIDVVEELVSYSNSVSANLKFTDGSDSSNGTPLVYNIGDEITPILSSYGFTGAQKDGFVFALRTAGDKENSHKTLIPVGTDKTPLDKYGVKLLVTYDKDGHPQLEIGQGTDFAKYKGTYVYIRVLNDQFSNAQQEKEFSIKLAGKAGETTRVLPAEAQLGVGQTLDLRTLSKSVDGVKSYWTVEPYGNYQTEKEAGMIAKIIMETVDKDNNAYGWTVKGLAPGVVTIKLRDAYNGKVLDSMKLNIGAGSVAAPTPSTANATVKVNEQVKLSVKNLNSDEYVKWSIDNNNVSLANYDGAAATVYGKKEGTAVVTAKVYESKAAANDGKDPINTFKINVTVKAAESKPVTTPGTTAPTTNPQTGDSLFANLF